MRGVITGLRPGRFALGHRRERRTRTPRTRSPCPCLPHPRNASREPRRARPCRFAPGHARAPAPSVGARAAQLIQCRAGTCGAPTRRGEGDFARRGCGARPGPGVGAAAQLPGTRVRARAPLPVPLPARRVRACTLAVSLARGLLLIPRRAARGGPSGLDPFGCVRFFPLVRPLPSLARSGPLSLPVFASWLTAQLPAVCDETCVCRQLRCLLQTLLLWGSAMTIT